MHKDTSFNTFLSTELNQAQQQAVTHKTGSILVVAGAGSGKTRVITTRITNLIKNHAVNPQSIIALTFTNKAATEMRERIIKFLGTEESLPFIGTFHSYCVRMLKQHQDKLDAPFFSILDEDDKCKLINSILQKSNLQKQISARQAAYQISYVKNHTVNPSKPALDTLHNPLMHDIFYAYEKEKKISKCLDFDDLLLETVHLFDTHTAFKHEFQKTIQHILVDEYQDTNTVQHALLKHMALANKKFAAESICVVGDEDQSIYSWRGATVSNILNFTKDFPKTTIIKIEQNYRSVQPILDAANHVITHNQERNPKKLWSDKKGKDRIRLLTTLTEYQEAATIVHCIEALHASKKTQEIAILYRTHSQSRALEEALIRQNITYKIIGGMQFYERKEIKDILAYLRLIINPFDRTSFFRVINTPARGLGEKFEELVYETWQQEPFLTFIDVLKKLIDTKEITGNKQKSVEQFLFVINGLDAMSTPYQATQQIIERSRYLAYLKDAHEPEDARARIENMQELIKAMQHFETENITTITQFIEEVTLMQEKQHEQDTTQQPVLMMTLHAAKGLEFDTVIIAGLEEGLLPSARSLTDSLAVEEERRLFYVGITRAKERLLITHAKYRYSYGQMVDQVASRFVSELPQSGIKHDDCTYWKNYQTQTYFGDWLGTPPIKNEFQSFAMPASVRETTKKKSCVSQPKTAVSPTKKGSQLPTAIRKNKIVTHKKYGVGVIEHTETRGEKTYVTVKFKSGSKKILATFLENV
ncbi:MAG TPA: 3'-5' exonuclease [Candidatus Dependentiae bacterium]|nr:3'-5' exonuclease [Candidatus Dependentiae bacterium]HRQ62263.1 3'-5' exonuclease [Candidatus Dependentiae bacterium]